MVLRSSVRRLAMLFAVAWMAPCVARAQLVTVTVEGASEEARAFTTAYLNAPGVDAWGVRGSLVRVYSVNDHVGTVRIRAVLEPNTAPRIVQGATSQQSLRLHTAWLDTTLASAGPLPPDQPVEVRYEFPYDAHDFGERVVVFSTAPYAARCGTNLADCSTIEGFLVFLTRVSPVLEIGAAGAVRPHLIQVPSRYARLQFPVQGLSPLTEVRDVLIDGMAMTRIPESLTESPGNGEWNRTYPTNPIDPITPGEVIYPYGDATSVDRFLGCGGGGCAMGGITLGLPADLTGLHTLAVRGSRWPDTFYTFFGGPLTTAPAPGEPAGSGDLYAEEDFIVVDPKISVSPPQAEPGSTITVTGTGFAPESQIPVRFHVQCCSVREPLGTATTDVTGAFTLQATLPTAPFTTVWYPPEPPGTTREGSILAMLGDAAFLQKYSLVAAEYSGAITFVKPGVTPSTTTTTSTTLPGTVEDGLDDVPACTATPVPSRAVQKYDAAEANLELVEQMIVESAARKAIRKVLGKADASLLKARHLVKRAFKHDLIPESCSSAAIDLIESLRDRAREARQSLKR